MPHSHLTLIIHGSVTRPKEKQQLHQKFHSLFIWMRFPLTIGTQTGGYLQTWCKTEFLANMIFSKIRILQTMTSLLSDKEFHGDLCRLKSLVENQLL